MKPSRSVFLPVRGLRYHLREWGPEAGAPLFLLHGWMDVSASFQFLVDALAGSWRVVAPDWRGFGLSEGHGDAYWFPDYLGDLDAILRHYSPQAPVPLVGHSMGGNVASLYAGIRPARVARLVAVDSFGLPASNPALAPNRFEKWITELAAPMGFRSYPGFDALSARLRTQNPRLSLEKSQFLARHLGQETDTGEVVMAIDPAHRRVNANLYRRDEALACWRRVSAPLLFIEPEDADLRRRMGVSDADHEEFLGCFPGHQRCLVANAGHNLHHDQPEVVARLIENFLLADRSRVAAAERSNEC